MKSPTKYLRGIYHFYREGFAGMTVGRSLWMLILIKVAILFLVLKLFFFPDIVGNRSRDAGTSPSSFVCEQMLDRTPENQEISEDEDY